MTDTTLSKFSPVFQDILKALGENPKRPGLSKTPERVLKAYEHLTSGTRSSLDEILKGSPLPLHEADMPQSTGPIQFHDLPFFSLCEHYMMPFYGKCTVILQPHGSLIGLSTVQKIVTHFSRQLQLQERLGEQIASTLEELLNPKGILVHLKGVHTCTLAKDGNTPTEMSTLAIRGDLHWDEINFKISN